MAKYETLNEAMSANDELAAAEIRYGLLAEVFEEMPQLRSNLNPQIERAKAEIIRLTAKQSVTMTPVEDGLVEVVAFDADRFRKSQKGGVRGAADLGKHPSWRGAVAAVLPAKLTLDVSDQNQSHRYSGSPTLAGLRAHPALPGGLRSWHRRGPRRRLGRDSAGKRERGARVV